MSEFISSGKNLSRSHTRGHTVQERVHGASQQMHCDGKTANTFQSLMPLCNSWMRKPNGCCTSNKLSKRYSGVETIESAVEVSQTSIRKQNV